MSEDADGDGVNWDFSQIDNHPEGSNETPPNNSTADVSFINHETTLSPNQDTVNTLSIHPDNQNTLSIHPDNQNTGNPRLICLNNENTRNALSIHPDNQNTGNPLICLNNENTRNPRLICLNNQNTENPHVINLSNQNTGNPHVINLRNQNPENSHVINLNNQNTENPRVINLSNQNNGNPHVINLNNLNTENPHVINLSNQNNGNPHVINLSNQNTGNPHVINLKYHNTVNSHLIHQSNQNLFRIINPAHSIATTYPIVALPQTNVNINAQASNSTDQISSTRGVAVNADMDSNTLGESMETEPLTITEPVRMLRSQSGARWNAGAHTGSALSSSGTSSSNMLSNSGANPQENTTGNRGETGRRSLTNTLRCILGIPEVINVANNANLRSRNTSVIVDGRNQSQQVIEATQNYVSNESEHVRDNDLINTSNNVEMEDQSVDIHEMLTQNLIEDAQNAPTVEAASHGENVQVSSENVGQDFEAAPSASVPNVDDMQEAYEELQTEVDNQIARINQHVMQVDSVISQNEDTSNRNNPDAPSTSEPPNKIAKLNESTASEDGGQTCTICFDPWTSSGDHRLTSLKCGHIFGLACIKRWLQGKETKNCPTCKSKAKLADLRYIYAKSLSVIDNSEVEQFKIELEATKEAKNRVELELQKSELNNYMYRKRIEALELRIKELEKSRCNPEVSDAGKLKRFRMALVTNIEIGNDNSCKFVAYNKKTCHLYASHVNVNPLFPGHGVRKVNMETHTAGKFIRLHSKPVRGMSYSYENNMLLSVSLDKTAKLMNEQDSIAITLSPDICLWSCSWDVENSNRLLLGGVGGVVLQYDIRQPRTYLNRICATGDVYPVAAVESVPGGFISCRHNSFNIHKRSSGFIGHTLPIEGPFVSTNYNAKSDIILMSSKISLENQIRHLVGRVYLEDDPPRFEKKQTIPGGNKQSVTSRSTMMNVGEDVWVAAYSESAGGVFLWNAETGDRLLTIGAQDIVLDMCPVAYNRDTFLATQSSNRTRLYQLMET